MSLVCKTPCHRVLYRGKTARAMFFPFVYMDVEFERSFTDILGQQSCCTIKHLTRCWPNNICALHMDHFSMKSIYVGMTVPRQCKPRRHYCIMLQIKNQCMKAGSWKMPGQLFGTVSQQPCSAMRKEFSLFQSVTNLQEAVSSHPVTTLGIFDKGTSRKCKQTNKQTKTFEEY